MGEEVQTGRENRGSPAALRARADAIIAQLAVRQSGRVSRRQLLASGVSPDAIDRRIAAGRLLVEHPGVYAVGYAGGGVDERWAMALLRAGDGSMLSNLASAAAWRIRLPAPQVVDVTTERRIDPVDGIRVHRRAIHPAERRSLRGFPLTSPAQTIFDLASMLGDAALLDVANEAFVERVVSMRELQDVLAHNPRRRGITAYRRMLAALDPESRTIMSPLEARLNTFLRQRRFPPWESNALLRLGGETIRPDVMWRRQRVIVEADGRDPHLSPITFASDRRRDRRLHAEGWQPVRVTSLDLDDRADELDADLRSLLQGPPDRRPPARRRSSW